MKSLVLGAALAAVLAVPAAAVASEAAHGEGAHGEGAHGEASHEQLPKEEQIQVFAEHSAESAPHINWFSFDSGDPNHPTPPLAMALFNFLVLIGLLVVFAGPKLRKYLHMRHDTIKADLEEGKRLREEAARTLEQYKTKIAGVDAEVDRLVREIRQQAEDEKARILAQAEAQAAQVKRDAEDRIAAEIERSRRLLEREVVNAAIAAAETILRGNTRDDDQHRMVTQFISDVESSTKSEAPQ